MLFMCYIYFNFHVKNGYIKNNILTRTSFEVYEEER